MSAEKRDTTEVIRRFNDAFQRHEPALLDDLIGEHCVLENTNPAPDGARYTGRAGCLSVWRGIAGDPNIRFDLDETVILGEHALIYWRLHWPGGNVRGINVMRVQGGFIVEARGYVKGA
ncbi:nuclear transport factor 2 family protein [Pendulispora albinea]|uniref:Nuclear transport factor 2 family protein n=1 Tax=Pendulispora albinea TaxID=2741071 RepID=A0ABZ2LYK2_9BACT